MAAESAVRCRVDLHPFALPWQIASVGAPGDHALKTGHKGHPFLSLRDGGGLSDEVEARAWLFEQRFEAIPPLALCRSSRDPPAVDGTCGRCGLRGAAYAGRYGGRRYAVCYGLQNGWMPGGKL